MWKFSYGWRLNKNNNMQFSLYNREDYIWDWGSKTKILILEIKIRKNCLREIKFTPQVIITSSYWECASIFKKFGKN